MLVRYFDNIVEFTFPSALEHFWHIGTVYCQCLFSKKKGKENLIFARTFLFALLTMRYFCR